MNKVDMIKFGRTLTDRPDGKKAFAAIVAEVASPIHLDFRGVMSLGSSFGDEVLAEIAKLQGNKISVSNANDGVRSCIRRVIEGTSIQVNFLDSTPP